MNQPSGERPLISYRSLPLAVAAQREGAPEFDLVVAHEAHRTTGIKRPPADASTDGDSNRSGTGVSPFLLVHDKERLRAAKRLFMTATPRTYTERAKCQEKENRRGVFSMDRTEYGRKVLLHAVLRNCGTMVAFQL